MVRAQRIMIPVVGLVIALAVPRAIATETAGVEFDPSPGADWQCGLTNEDLPGMVAEGMRQPLAAGCGRAEARAYTVMVDLSDSRSVMRAEQMAADAEEQLSSSWKIESKTYDVVSLPGGRTAAYSRLVGRGDGFTFLSGETPMIAISANVPLLFEDESGVARQVIAVFRLRSPIPAGAAKRKEAIADFDRILRSWAGTAHPAKGRAIAERDFELAAYARQERLKPAIVAAATISAPPAPGGNQRVAAALTAAMNGRATPDDVAILQDAEKKFPHTALGTMARTLTGETQQSSRQREQQQILNAALDAAAGGGHEVLSRFLVAAIDSQDAAGLTTAVSAAKQRGWTLRDVSPAAAAALAEAVFNRSVPLAPPVDDRGFFELSSTDLLLLARQSRSVPLLEEIARPDRNGWRMKNTQESRKPSCLVQHDSGVGVLERQQGSETYRYRPLTNLLDLGAIGP